jgi:UDP-N-acetylmuramoylalanine--D-glutamate ligase
MKRVVVLGAGISGLGACKLAKDQGYSVFLSDKGKIKDSDKKVLETLSIPFEEGSHSEEKILDADLVIKSPGIPDAVPLIRLIREKDIEVISEIEFAYRYKEPHQKIIAITGSNGKTTTTSLIYHILKQNGFNVCVAGNIGESFAQAVSESKAEYFVLELSSFQLDGCFDFKPDISLLLNITPDHLDRYANLEAYEDSKWSIAKNIDSSDVFIAWKEEPTFASKIKTVDAQVKTFSSDKDGDVFLEKEKLKTTKGEINLSNCKLKGEHNYKNIMAAWLVADQLKISIADFEKSCQSFSPVEHRLEFVKNINGVDYINDSKATNVDATRYALGSIENNIIWIAGGVDKGNDYSLLVEFIPRIKELIILGEYKKNLEEAFLYKIPKISYASSMDEAVNLSFEHAIKGDSVLLSPACASFDLFKNYEHRGEEFKNRVEDIACLKN